MSHKEVPREMSNRIINQTGGGYRPNLRSLGIGRGGSSLCLILGLLVCASSVLAAEIVEVRVGRHAEFTRVVFELDRAAGYRIERADPTSDVTELVVSLEASTIPRRIQSSKSLIEQVEVEPSGSRSIARIRLTKDGLRLKEMILASPPRIVIDVLSDQPVVAKVAKSAPAPVNTPSKAMVVPEEAVPSLDEPTFEQIVAQLPGDAEAGAPTVVADAVETTTDSAPAAEATPQVAVVDEPTISTPLDEDELAQAEMPSAGEAGQLADSQAPAAAQPEAATRRPRPMVVRTKPAKDESMGWMTWALAGGGVVLLLVGGLLVAKRMGGGEEADFSDDDGMGFEGGDNTGSATSGAQAENDENPFGALGEDGRQMTLGGSDVTGSTASAALSEDEEKESESVVFGDSGENSMEDMEVISREQVNESLGSIPAASGGVPEEFQQMMREMNLRVESLEGRIDELVDARDRLERQVAAQTEELRVQRAAIARTQRAVRNLARPEDGEGDQEPTEPALRDPNQPSGE